MSSNQVASFEQRLRKAVRRLSRKRHYDDAVREVTGHFQDLYQEQISTGVGEVEANRTASRRLGLIGDIARQIVSSSAEVAVGKRLQVIGVISWVCVPFIWSYIANWLGTLHLAGQWLFVVDISLMILPGMLVAVGCFLARKLLPKQLLGGFAAYLLIAAGVYVYRTNQNSQLQENWVRRENEIRQEILAERQYENLEATLLPCLQTSNNIDLNALDRLRSVLLQTNLGFTGLTGRRSGKYVFLWDQSHDNGQLYRFSFAMTDSKDDARLMWRTVHISRVEFSQMVEDRKRYFAFLRSQLNAPSRMQSMVEFMVVFRFAPFAMGLLVGAFALRLYIYRLEAFRVGLRPGSLA